MATLDDLRRELESLDGRGYKSYRRIGGAWEGEGYTLFVDHVQGDPYATPSRLRARIPHDTHRLAASLRSNPARRIGLADYLLEIFAEEARELGSEGSGGSGRVRVDAGDAEILERSGCVVFDEHVELRFRVGLPARGRRILGRAAARLLAEDLPRAIEAIRASALDLEELEAHVDLVEDHAHLQEGLAERGLVAFLADGSVLPRRSGVSSRPLAGAVPLESPESLRVTLPTLHHGEVTGMGIPEGVTLLVGGGFHGKTTLLEAVARGVHPHVPGDGREWVVTRDDVVKVRSEDGRAVTGVDLRPFIRDLPRGRSTERFDTPDASGSTSLAAAILEAVELGAGTLLLDEDTCATNLLVRDARMQRLVEAEPIVPLIERVRGLHREHGVSTLLALGASGDYLEVADRVIRMTEYVPEDVTEAAASVVREVASERETSASLPPFAIAERRPLPRSFDARGRRSGRRRVKARGLRELTLGEETIELSAIEQLVDDSQVRLVGALLERAPRLAKGGATLRELVTALVDEARRGRLVGVADLPELAMVRTHELGAAINRLRSLELA